MADTFGYEDRVDSPASRGAAVTPSDDTDLGSMAKALFIGTGGDVTVKMRDAGTTLTFKNVADGAILPVRVSRVMATDTTATDIVALF